MSVIRLQIIPTVSAAVVLGGTSYWLSSTLVGTAALMLVGALAWNVYIGRARRRRLVRHLARRTCSEIGFVNRPIIKK
jgi:hypothetical protein